MSLSQPASRSLAPSARFRRRSRTPVSRRQPWRLLSIEYLEDRIVLSINTLDVAGLRFVASAGFQSIGNDYSVSSGTVSIGYTPIATEKFLPLVQAVQSPGTTQFAFTLKPDETLPSFEVTDTELDLVAVGGSPSIPIPIWKDVSGSSEDFDITDLKTTGVLLTTGTSDPITVANLDFTLSTLLFDNPGSGTTANAQVKMQGDVSFDNVPVVKDLNISAHVGGPMDPQNNYVIADNTGITLTGMDVTKDIPSDVKVAGMAVSGSVNIGYSHADNSFTFGGSVRLTSDGQGSDNKAALDNVAATLQVTVAGGKLGTFGFGISGGFKVFDLNVSTANEQPILLSYDALLDQFEIHGGLQLEFNFNTVSVNLDDGMGGPGLVIVDGHLTQFHAIVNADFILFGATINATNLTFQYSASNTHGQSQFEMYGDLSLTIPTENTADTKITAHLGTEADPGLILQNGTLTQINMGVSGDFDVFGFHVTAAGANLDWQKTNNTDVFIISGGFTADFRVFQVSVTLGDSPTTGLVIQNGSFQLKDATFALDNATLGPVTLEELKVQWQEPSQGNFTVDVGGKVLLPGGWEVDAEFVFDQNGFESITVSANFGEGIPIGDTGLFVTDLGGSIQNLENPSQIIVSAHLGVTWGETFMLFGKEVNLFHAEGDITVDANELILSGSVQMGEYSTDNGTTWQGVAGSGDAKLTLDWGDKVYSLHVDVNGLFGFIDLSGDLTFNAGNEIKFLATAYVVIPSEVPFIGGDKIAGVGFYFDHVFAHGNVPTSTTIAAWLSIDVIWTFEVGFEEVYDDAHPNGSFSLIGAGTIGNFTAAAQPPVNQTYTYTADLAGLVPGNATSATLSADWSKPAAGVTIVGTPTFSVQRTLNGTTQTIPEDQFAANGIQLIDDPHFSSPTKKAIQIVGSKSDAYSPITGDYKLLVSVTSAGGNPFPDYGKSGNFPDVLGVQATYHVPKPTFGPQDAQAPYVPVVPPTPSGAFSVTLQGTIDQGFLTSGKAQVSLYRVLVQDPQQGAVLLGTSPLSAFSGNGLNWQATVDVPIEGLYPVPYTVYAVVSDGFNAPVKTANSASFTPEFAVAGSVSNQNHDAKTGWSVFLDYNQDGEHESNEPIYQTSNPGGFYAFAPTFAASTGWDAVPVGRPFNVQLIVPGAQNFAPVAPATITFDGQDTETVPFVVQEKSAIKGTVFEDVQGNGVKKDGTPIPGATVYLDVNHDGVRDSGEPTAVTDTNGNYDFANPAPGSYTVGLDLLAPGTPPVVAYNVPAGTVGQYNILYNLSSWGMEFYTNEPVLVTSLGLFDSGQTGWDVNAASTDQYTAQLYDNNTEEALATVYFNTNNPGTLIGGSRFIQLPQPLLLPAGFYGTIAGSLSIGTPSKSFGYYKGQTVTWTTNSDQGALSFVGSGYVGFNASFPSLPDSGPPNAYAAGSFLYSVPEWVPTKPPSGTHTVTIDKSGFDLSEGNDFGAVHPAKPSVSLLQPVTDQHATVGALLSFVVTLTTAGTSGDPLVFALEPGAPAGATIDPATGRFTWTPTSAGRYTVAVRIRDPLQPSVTEVESFTITVDRAPTTAVTAVTTVTALKRFGFHEQPTTLVLLSFSGALDPARAQDVRQYHIALLSGEGHDRARVIHRIAVRRAVYDPSAHTVTLYMSQRLNIHRVYQITVNGASPKGLIDLNGRFLDGQDSGKPGSNFVSRITRATLAGRAPAASDPIGGRRSERHRAQSDPHIAATAVDRLATSGELTARPASPALHLVRKR